MLWPHRWAAVVPMMGGGVRHFEGETLPLLNLAQLPLLFLHGADDRRITSRATQETLEELRRVGPAQPLEMRILEGREHDVFLDNDDELVVPFLQKHAREPFPRRVRFQTRTLQFPRSHWIEILDKDEGMAEVEARIGNDNTIRLRVRKVRRLRVLLRRELMPREGQVRVVLNDREVFAGSLPEDCALLAKTSELVSDPYLAHSAELIFDVSR
jgi:hypothetical protein